jgi:hypothetical protein
MSYFFRLSPKSEGFYKFKSKFQVLNSMKPHTVEALIFHADRPTKVMSLTAALHNSFTKASKNWKIIY